MWRRIKEKAGDLQSADCAVTAENDGEPAMTGRPTEEIINLSDVLISFEDVQEQTGLNESSLTRILCEEPAVEVIVCDSAEVDMHPSTSSDNSHKTVENEDSIIETSNEEPALQVVSTIKSKFNDDSEQHNEVTDTNPWSKHLHWPVTEMISKKRRRIQEREPFFSSVGLFSDLKDLGLGACGTVRANRKHLPASMRTLKQRKGEMPAMWINEDKSVIACTWQDTGKVNMLSTVGDTNVTVVTSRSKSGDRRQMKPNIQILYNKNMGGVDHFDKFSTTYCYAHKSMKWYQPIWHFLIEVGLVNGCIAYNMQENVKPLTHKQFRKAVIDGLLKNHEMITPKVRRGRRLSDTLSTQHLSGRIHVIDQFPDKSHKPNCAVCAIMPSSCKMKGKGACKRKQTTYFCKTCADNPPLCIVPCFKTYHSKRDFKKVCKC
ncbi:hypothetical protein LSTR_LSTR003185 [Laodelphax striatellus]|uniref:PiggyBac transposable element-derived protein domain-containing protein n=1 Tax=Laodelphax striatellus TaxID=195883 RepID=A0A482XRM8_LAOST|nr:hypothetical protein LSTR_LSTR003185 [Laodelphax striatellus]